VPILTVGQPVQRNGSLWADVFLVKNGTSPDPSNPSFDPHSVHHIRKRETMASWFSSPGLTCVAVLTRYMPKAKARKEKNLLSNPDDNEGAEEVRRHHISSLVTF
jgi:hypothetical protein